jgi:hypothetical protein
VHFHYLLLSYHSIFSRHILVTNRLFAYSRLLLSYYSIFFRRILVTNHLFVYSRLHSSTFNTGNTVLSLIYALSSAPLHTLEFQVYPSHLLATDLNTGTVTVSLNCTLQISHRNNIFQSHVKSRLVLFSLSLSLSLSSPHLELNNCGCYSRYIAFTRTHTENTASPIVEARLLIDRIAMVTAQTYRK